MYVSNRANFGHLLSVESFDTTHLFNEMWQLVENRWDWEQRYLHPNYSQALAKDFQNEMVSSPGDGRLGDEIAPFCLATLCHEYDIGMCYSRSSCGNFVLEPC